VVRHLPQRHPPPPMATPCAFPPPTAGPGKHTFAVRSFVFQVSPGWLVRFSLGGECARRAIAPTPSLFLAFAPAGTVSRTPFGPLTPDFTQGQATFFAAPTLRFFTTTFFFFSQKGNTAETRKFFVALWTLLAGVPPRPPTRPCFFSLQQR